MHKHCHTSKHRVQVKHSIHNCCEPEVCGCPIKLSTNCVIYDGNPLLNLDIRKGDRLEEILKIIDRAFRDVDTANDDPSPFFVASNFEQEEPAYQGTEVYSEQFIGTETCILERPFIEILSVSYCGIVLDTRAYTYTDNDTVFIDVDGYGIEVEEDDVIQIIYKA